MEIPECRTLSLLIVNEVVKFESLRELMDEANRAQAIIDRERTLHDAA